jgi:small subunit ribosomal protein S1
LAYRLKEGRDLEAKMDIEDLEGNDPEFSELLEKSLGSTKRLNRGDVVEATVLEVSSEWVYLDLGGKSDGVIHRSEFLEEGKEVRKGEKIRAYYLGRNEAGELFTTRITDSEIAKTYIREAWKSGIPVQGIVEKEIKGGYQVKIPGGFRGFCPFSQMGRDLTMIEGERPEGKTLEFKIVEYSEGGRRVILSRKALLEEEEAKRWEELKDQFSVGKRISGKVASVRGFGVFVDLGGIEGLIPLSELGWGDPKEALEKVKIGQELELCVVDIDWNLKRILLSQKRALPDPWEKAGNLYPEGSVHKGKVTRIAPFGAFVALEPGVEGLVHISRLGAQKRIKSPREVVKEGDELLVKVESLDLQRKRLSLSVAGQRGEAEEVTEEEIRAYSQDQRARPTLGDLLRQKMEERKRIKSGK